MCSTKYCLRESNKKELSCRFKFPFENCAKTRIDFEAINTKSGQTNYRATMLLVKYQIQVTFITF